jgi:hypothetical protein
VAVRVGEVVGLCSIEVIPGVLLAGASWFNPFPFLWKACLYPKKAIFLPWPYSLGRSPLKLILFGKKHKKWKAKSTEREKVTK